MIEFVVGAGGKTSYIHKRTKEELALGHTVLVCTSTHMLIEEDTLIDPTLAQIKEKKERCGYCMAGSKVSDQKIGPLDKTLYDLACSLFDVVLVEADGSRHKPIKACTDKEPVIYSNVDHISIIMGMHALGKRFEEVAFRLDEVCKLLNVKKEDIVDANHIVELIQKAYLLPLSRAHSKTSIQVHCVGYTLYQKAVAELINEQEDPALLFPEWFLEKPVLFLCGGGHVSLAVARMATLLDMDVIVFDDRKEFANKERFDMAKRVIVDKYENLHRYLVSNGYYVVVTRGHTADAICVKQVLSIDPLYLGMIGSKSKVQRTKEALASVWKDSICAPIGLDIHANTPAEIAISILAQIVSIKNSRPHSSVSRELLECDSSGVLCVLLDKKGSSPREVGSMMFVTDSDVIDTIGGGILESRVIERAKTIDRVMQETIVLEDIGMACAGKNTILYIPIR